MPHTNSKEWLKRNKLSNRKPSSSKKTSSSGGSKTVRRPHAVEYDEKDRYEYLTGFSARKKAGKLAAQERAAQKAREEKLEFRRQLKDARMSKIKEAIDQQTEWYGSGYSTKQSAEAGTDRRKVCRTVERWCRLRPITDHHHHGHHRAIGSRPYRSDGPPYQSSASLQLPAPP
ncbi:hypothetical protein PTTG_26903 [Puccinia triticina 1-1 BBBD Race 1]|uniref:Uncharacterized protein n=1 Tax=Puccinia triticina (isolate 1-1 / race 1 (BBBD)) TaxID=630390 RepID=A0A180GQ86_PUCT1|nr:hypothetical protein PTTG_26903 [Puccinia triticina 1-1 BBBD Race 1]